MQVGLESNSILMCKISSSPNHTRKDMLSNGFNTFLNHYKNTNKRVNKNPLEMMTSTSNDIRG